MIVDIRNDSKLIREWDWKNNLQSPDKLCSGSHKKLYWICEYGHPFQTTLEHRIKRGDGCPYCSGRRALKGFNDLCTVLPKLAGEWDYEKNYPSQPAEYTKGSNVKVWWICENMHSWQAKINDRAKGKGCPFCKGKKTISGKNDLAIVYPWIIDEWDYEKNEINPSSLSPHSNTMVNWKCKYGHKWLARVKDRTRQDGKATGCPYCDGRKAIIGVNDLASQFPDVASEWDYERNKNKPNEYTEKSNAMVSWKCRVCGEVWTAAIYSRVEGKGCPYCSGRRVRVGKNDLKTTHEYLIKEWDFEKNGKLFPEMFSARSNKRVYWKCLKGHSWKTSIYHRMEGTSCPRCQGI